MFLPGVIHDIGDLVDGMRVLMGFVHGLCVFVDRWVGIGCLVHGIEDLVDEPVF